MSGHGRRFFSADQHFCHHGQAARRGFDDTGEHDRYLIDAWNRTVSPGDTAFLMGDMGVGPEEAILERLSALSGTKYLLYGNHDAVFPAHKGALDRSRRDAWLAVFEAMDLHGRCVIDRQPVMLSHLPYAGDHTPADRFAQWRPRDEGLWLLCGHVHDKWRQLGRQVNVGLDAWRLRPVPESALVRLIRDAGYQPPGSGLA